MTLSVLPTNLAPDEKLVLEVVATLFFANHYFHVAHLQARDHSVHVVLGDIYALCDSSADRLFEEQAGRGFNLSALSVQTPPSPAFLTQSVDALHSVDTLLQYLSDTSDTVQDSQLRSTLEDIRGSLYRQRYLLSLTKAALGLVA